MPSSDDEREVPSKFDSPFRLTINASHPKATLKFEHWLRILEGGIDQLSAPTDSQKFLYLTRSLSADNYALIKNCARYKDAIDALKLTFVRKPNLMRARYDLATRKQGPEENLRDYADSLLQLVPDCQFVGGQTVEQVREDRVRDIFIWGLRDPLVRTHILEKGQLLSLEQTIESAKIFADARRDSAILAPSLAMPTLAATEKNTANAPLSAPIQKNVTAAANLSTAPLAKIVQRPNLTRPSQASDKKTVKCRNCGNYLPHTSGRCPAADRTCNYCRRIGHFAKICNARFRGEPPAPKPMTSYNTATSTVTAVPSMSEMNSEAAGFIPNWATKSPPTEDPGKISLTISNANCMSKNKQSKLRNDNLNASTIRVFVNNYPCDALVDSGSNQNFISQSLAGHITDLETVEAPPIKILFASNSEGMILSEACLVKLTVNTQE